MISLDKQQQEVVNSASDKICVIAGAGSGKTGVLIERIRRLLKEGKNPAGFVCITFTKMAAQEMRSRLSDISGSNGMFIGTIHSYAYKVLARAGKRANLLTPEKERDITRTLIDKYAKYLTLDKYDEWAKRHRLKDLGYLKQSEVKSILTLEEAEELAALLDHISLDDIYSTMSADDVEALTKRVMERESKTKTSKIYPETMRSMAQKLGMITFNGLLEECNKSGIINRIEYLFVDEFQDIGAFEYKFLMGLNAKNIFVVGDDYQCQPAGTQVMMYDNTYKNIEDIQPGDVVMSWDLMHNDPVGGTVRVVQKSLTDQLIKVSTAHGKVSYYTPNHTCIVRRFGSNVMIDAKDLSISDSMLTMRENCLEADDITNISKRPCIEETVVYSLEVDDWHCFFADDLLTHNSIYSFKGSDFEYFQKLAKDKDFNTYKMANNYRCEPHIVEFGNKIISRINDVIPKKCVSKVKPVVKGKVIHKRGNLKDVEKYITNIDSRDYGKWFILTRSNNDMIDISRMCYRLNIPTVTFKKSNTTGEEMQAALSSNALKLLTVHSAKGLESDNVLLYGMFPLEENFDWETWGTEECRIFYVGATRARKNLIVISNEDC